MNGPAGAEDTLRELAPRVLGALARRYGHFDLCEDAVQEALVAATEQWPRDGVPRRPMSWLITVASRRLADALRSEEARRRREDAEGRDVAARPAPPADASEAAATDPEDDTLTLLLMCCHPSLTPGSQLALTLRAVGGLTTAEVASALLVPEATAAQRIVRAKQRIRDDGARFELPQGEELDERLRVVLHVLYLMFNEGYTSSSGPDLHRPELARAAIRLTRAVHDRRPDDAEVAGLLALMLLNDSRRAARTGPAGELVPLADQDRTRWDRDQIAEGVDLITRALGTGAPGPYQLQAAIAAVHAESPSTESTDWPQVLALYELLEQVAPGPMVTLNRAVALAMVHGPAAGLELLDSLVEEPQVRDHHRVHAVRAHLLELAGDLAGARSEYVLAARRTTSTPERRHLEARAARVGT